MKASPWRLAPKALNNKMSLARPRKRGLGKGHLLNKNFLKIVHSFLREKTVEFTVKVYTAEEEIPPPALGHHAPALLLQLWFL